MLMSMGPAPKKEEDAAPESASQDPESDTGSEAGVHSGAGALTHPEWVDGGIDVAASVNDGMSFSEAFAQARHEVGAGGVFEWNGGLYGTYYADEWNNMSAQQRAEYGSHFSWNHIDHSDSDVAHHDLADSNADTPADGGDEVTVVAVEPPDTETEAPGDDLLAQQEEDPAGLPNYLAEAEAGAEHEVVILGVSYDNEVDAYIGNLSIDGREVIVVDVDGDMTFDYLGADLNNDGSYDTDEIIPIYEDHLTVDDLGGLTDASYDMLAMQDDAEPADILMSDDAGPLMEDPDLFPGQTGDLMAFNDDSDFIADGGYDC